LVGETEAALFDSRNNGWRSFAFDRVWGPSSTQLDVFLEVEALSLSVVDGYNVCIFAYGQTGSGKTHTMVGDTAEDAAAVDENGRIGRGAGITPRVVAKVRVIFANVARGVTARLTPSVCCCRFSSS